MTHGKAQWIVYSALLGTNALLAFLTFALGLHTEFMVGQDVSAAELPDVPAWVLGLGNAAIILVVYGLLGLAGLCFARRLGWPGVFRQDAGWRNWLWMPMGVYYPLDISPVDPQAVGSQASSSLISSLATRVCRDAPMGDSHSPHPRCPIVGGCGLTSAFCASRSAKLCLQKPQETVSW